MSARRQASTTSLSKYARTTPSAASNHPSNFCNAFWGIADGGVEVLFTRMRGAARTMEEMKNYWKERAIIEEDYAKRLTKLAKVALGRDEIGELRNSLDTIRLETDKQAGHHFALAHQIRTDLQTQAAAFNAKQAHHKKSYQSSIEKEFRAKQTQESYVNTAREKYEADCVRINSYTAQSTLVQGKDFDKIQLKLERAQQTVQANERDFANFAKALQDTAQKWEHDWRAFCDTCQDLEEERLEFMRDNMWGYANALSTVCVSDDESCERIRLALEQMEAEKDMENFVRDYGTGNQIPDPPPFVNYATGEAPPSRPTTRLAQFTRTSQRPPPSRSPPVDEEPTTNAAGVGAGGGRKGDQQPDAALHRRPTANQSTSRERGPTQVNGSSVNGVTTSSSSSRRPTKPSQDQPAETIDPTADTYIRNPTRPAGSSSLQQGPKGSDPLAEQMENLKNAATGSVRRSGNWKQSDQRPGQSSRKGTVDSTTGPSLTPPSSSANASGSQGKSIDYRKSAEFVVGPHPSTSRPSSPNPPSPSFMRPPQQGGPPSSVDVGNVLADYSASLPGEHKTVSRPSSRQGSHSDAPSNQGTPSTRGHNHTPSQSFVAPPRGGHPGIGAYGRSSPHPISRSGSPAPGNASNFVPPPHGGAGYGSAPPRNPSPSRVGIVLGPNGEVIRDEMADKFQQMPPHHYNNQGPQRQTSISTNSSMGSQPPYGILGPSNPGYQPPPQTPSYMPTYNQAPSQYTQPSQQHGYPLKSHPGQYAPPTSAINSHQHGAYGGGYRAPSPSGARAPSPLPPQGAPPTGQTTEEGAGILFYVKALYDYNATIDEEFDFQTGDIIAVTSTPEDGWWSGELLDEARRQPGRHVFPSNFVCLF